MSERDLGSRVGVFVLTGFLVIAYLILHFGKFGDQFRGGYELNVRFSNSSGLIPESKVLYSGVEVGKVKSIQLDPEGHYVDVILAMFNLDHHKYIIRKDAKFTIKRSGLLGDVFINILPGTESMPEVKPGEILQGSEPASLGEMAESAEDLLKKLNDSIDKLSTNFLNDQTLEDLRASAKNMRELTENINKTSGQLNKILSPIEKGQGTIGKLIRSEEIYDNARALFYNLRKGGVVFYKDRYDKDMNQTEQQKEVEKKEKAKQDWVPKAR